MMDALYEVVLVIRDLHDVLRLVLIAAAAEEVHYYSLEIDVMIW